VEFNLADLFESLADTVGARTALVCGDQRLTYAELDARANRLAHALQAAGVKPGDHVGMYLYNGTEYVEGMLACLKIRAVPINVNYRYVEAELRYLYEDADLVALIHHAQFGSQVAAASDGHGCRISAARGGAFLAAAAGSQQAIPKHQTARAQRGLPDEPTAVDRLAEQGVQLVVSRV